MAGFLAESIDAIMDSLKRAIHFEELVVEVLELFPKQLAVVLLVGMIQDLDAAHFIWRHPGRGGFGRCAQQTFAQVHQSSIMP